MKLSDEQPKKVWKVGLLAIVAVVVLVLGGWFAWSMTSPPMPENIEDIEALFADSRYQGMTDAEQQPYLERVNEMWGGMSNEDRRRLAELLRSNPDTQEEARNAMVRGMRDMYTNSVRSGNTALIDQMADQMGNRMAQEMGNGIDVSEEQMEQGREQMNQFLDSGDPQALGFMSEVMKGMMERRRARGQGGL
ncbi:MAG: hypothetical protein ACIAXF_01340 [Phycisphaerales bacterium JB063]